MNSDKEPVYVVTDKDNEQAIDFLKRWQPKGFWQITSISTATPPKIESKMFRLDDADKALAWVSARNGKTNMYFTVNPLMKMQDKKAKKEHMRGAGWLHVDVDPNDASPESRDKCLDALMNCEKQGLPKPSVVIFSGGGYQGFWKLNETQVVDGDIALCEEFERYNQEISRITGGDHCHNIDRIMRLPGTMNVPTATKLKKGRTPQMARLMKFETLSYDIAEFKKLAVPKTAGGSASGGSPSDRLLPYDGIAIDHPNDLDQYVSEGEFLTTRTKNIISLGNCPKHPMNDDDSGRLFYIAGLLQSQGVPQNIIMRIFMDRDWGISAHVFKNGFADIRAASRAILNSAEALAKSGDPYKKERLAKSAEFAKKKEKKEKKKAKAEEKKNKQDPNSDDFEEPLRTVIADLYEKTYDEARVISYEQANEFICFNQGDNKGWWKFSEKDVVSTCFNRLETIQVLPNPKPVAVSATETVYNRLFKKGKRTAPNDWSTDKADRIPFADGGKCMNLKHIENESLPMIIDASSDVKIYRRFPCTSEEFARAESEFEGSKTEYIINRIFKDEFDKRDQMQEELGLGILNRNPRQTFQWWVGLPGYGKSTLQEALMEAVGKHNPSAGDANADMFGYGAHCPKGTFVKSFSSKENDENNNPLMGALLATGNEIAASSGQLNIETINAVAANGSMNGRIMYKGNVNFKSTSYLVLQGNAMLPIPAGGGGIERRLRNFRFNNDQRGEGAIDSKELDKIFVNERHIMLWWIFEGAKRYYRNGKQLTHCQAVDDESAMYLASQDTTRDHIDSVLIKGGDDDLAFYDDIIAALHHFYPTQKYEGKNASWFGTEIANREDYIKAKRRIQATKKTGGRAGFALKGYIVKTYTKPDNNGGGGSDNGGQDSLADRSGDNQSQGSNNQAEVVDKTDKTLFYSNGKPRYNAQGEPLDAQGEIIPKSFG